MAPVAQDVVSWGACVLQTHVVTGDEAGKTCQVRGAAKEDSRREEERARGMTWLAWRGNTNTLAIPAGVRLAAVAVPFLGVLGRLALASSTSMGRRGRVSAPASISWPLGRPSWLSV